jgi:hypothetical protein
MPYLASHGGVPDQMPAGLNAFEGVALLLFVVGSVCLAVAVFRARVLPWWVGAALLASLGSVFLVHGGRRRSSATTSCWRRCSASGCPRCVLVRALRPDGLRLRNAPSLLA